MRTILAMKNEIQYLGKNQSQNRIKIIAFLLSPMLQKFHLVRALTKWTEVIQ
jgi:hypothetical protein